MTNSAVKYSEWNAMFTKKIQKRKFENFSLLLCDVDEDLLDSCGVQDEDSQEQRQLLYRVLFEDHLSVDYWSDYCCHTIAKFPSRRLQLQRLINKALEFIDEQTNTDGTKYLNLHMHLAKLKSDEKESLKYYKDVILKREIGRSHAGIYLSAAALELQVSSNKEAALQLLQTGVDNQAQPINDLIAKMTEIKASVHSAGKESTPAAKSAGRSSKREAARSDSSDEEDGVTEQITRKIDLPKAAALPAAGSKAPAADASFSSNRSSRSSSAAKAAAAAPPTVPVPRAPVGGLPLGKCVRVVPLAQDDSFDMEISDDEALTVAIKSEEKSRPKVNPITAISSSSSSSISSVSRKPDLSKFIDDKLINFDPNSFRKKSNSSTSSSSSSNSSSKQTSSKVEVPRAREAAAKPKSKAEAAKPAAPACKHSAKKPRLSLSDEEDSGGFSFDVSVCEITRKIEQQLEAPVIPAQQQQQHGKSQPQSTSSSSSESAADKRKRVSFAHSAAADQRPLTDAEVREADDSRRASSRSGGSLRMDSEDSRASKALASDPSPHKVLINGRAYTRLGVLGKGGSSCVYRVLSEEGALYAYKRVDVKENDDSDGVFESYINEINLLRRLKGSRHIIELIDAEVSREDNYIAMVMEIGDVDLAKNISQQQRSGGNSELNPFFVRMIWQEMLEAVDHIHENRIVHGDLKPANFVFVKGHLKLIDFGIAKAFSNDTTNIYRDSQIGTINYMAPEAIAPMADADTDGGPKMRLGKQSDIWSLGCILYQLLFGKPPFSALNTIQKLHAIPNPKYLISYPSHHDSDAVETIKLCLERDPKKRIAIGGEVGLLTLPFLKLAPSGSAGIRSAEGSLSTASSHSNDTTKSSLDGTTSHFDIPAVAIEDVKKGVDMVVKTVQQVSARQPGGISKPHSDYLCMQVWCLLTHKPVPPPYVQSSTDKECISDQENIAQPTATSGSNRQKISMRDLQGSKLTATATSTRPGAPESRQALNTLPDNLQQQLIRQQSSLSSAKDSKRASKWMKAAAMSPKQDLRSQLERKIGDIRKLLTDNNDTTDFTNDFNDNTM